MIWNQYNHSTFQGMWLKLLFYMYGALVSSMLVGSLYFNKLSFVKTGLIICGICVAFFLINFSVANLFFNNVSDAFPFFRVGMNLPSTEKVIESSVLIRPVRDEASVILPQPYHSIVQSIIQYALAIILSITAYIRLKEKEF